MAIEIINVGASPNDGNGDPIRDAFIKCNDNFDELDTTKIAGSGTDNFVAKFSGTDSIENSLIFDDGSFVGVNTTSPTTNLEVSGPDYSFSAGRQASNRKVSIGLNDNGQPSIQSFDSSNAPVNLTINPSGGNLGIGTLNPSTKLNINGNLTGNGLFIQVNGASNTYLGNEASWLGSGTSTNSVLISYNSLLLGTNDTERMRITSSGNVGIGTTSPNVELALYQATTPRFHLQNSTSGTGSTSGFQIALSSTDSYLWNFQNGATIFGTANTEKMRITSNGNVGIGTTSPVSKFQVNGGGLFTGGTHTDASLVNAMKIGFNSTDNYGFLESVQVDATSRPLRINQYGGATFFGGNVGIGTTSPVSKLQVVGLPEYATNALAISAGLTIGAFYHTAGVLKVVI